MVFEALAGMDIVEGGLLATEVAGGLASGVATSAVAGGVVGFTATSPGRAALYSALAGAALPLFIPGRSAPDKIIFSMLTSTSVGLIAHYLKTHFTEREDQRRASVHPVSKG